MKIRPLASLSLFAALCLLLCTAQQAWAVPPATTTTTLAITSGATPVTTAVYGTAVTLTATVTANGAPVTIGQVNFCDASATYCTDIHILGTAPLTAAGTAILKFVPAGGSHTYKAVFVSTPADATSSSTAASLSVNATPSTTAIAQTGSAGNYTLTATVSSTGALVTPTGTVSFLDTSNGNASLGTATLAASATPTVAWTNSQSPTTQADPQSIVVADFNGDGIPDLAAGTNGTTATNGVGYLSILIGNGDGTYKPATNFAALASNHVIAAAPFVTGGPMDIISVSNSASSTNNAVILTGNGTGGGTVGAPFSLAVGSVAGVATGDFNGDGKQDFAVAGQLSGTYAVAVYFGKGDGTFTSATLLPFSAAPAAIAVGSFHGTSALDIAVATLGAGSVPGSVDVFLNDGAGNFVQGVGSITGVGPVAMVAGDFNGDGKTDLATLNATANTVTINIGSGDTFGTFTAMNISPATGAGPTAIAAGDFNGDGKVDLAVTNASTGTSAGTVTSLIGNGDGSFNARTSPATGIGPAAIAAGNFNGDATADLAVANLNIGNSTATGTLTILVSQLTLSSTATVTNISPTGTGTHLVDASYPGDTVYASSVSTTTSLSAQAGTPTTTALTLIATPTTSTFGQQVVLSATLAPFSAGSNTTNGETITFFNGATSLGTGTLASGVATLNITSLPVGADNLTAKYAGDTNFTTSTSTAATETVTAVAATTTLTLTANPTTSTFGQQVVLSATLAPFSAGSNTTNGEIVTFFNGTTSLGTGILAGGIATLNTTTLPVGTDSLTAKFAGDTNFATSTSAAATETVAALLPIVSLTPATLTFTSQALTTQSTAQNVTLMNTGLGTLNITSITASTGFVDTPACASTLAAGASCTIAVKFAPTVNGNQTGTLTVVDNATGSPHIVTLTGAGPTVTVGATSSSLNITAPGGSGTTTINIVSVAGFSGTVNLTCAVTYTGTGTATNIPTCTLNPNQVTAVSGSTVTTTLTVNTTASASANPNLLWPRSGTVLATLFLIGLLPRRRWKNTILLAILAIAAVSTLSGCGTNNGQILSASHPGTTIGNYQVGVTAASTGFTATTTIPLTLQ